MLVQSVCVRLSFARVCVLLLASERVRMPWFCSCLCAIACFRVCVSALVLLVLVCYWLCFPVSTVFLALLN